MDKPTLILIQASSTSWQGGQDACMTIIENSTIIGKTINLLKNTFPDTPILLIAPQFDSDGELVNIAREFNIQVTFNHDSSPAKRIEEATNNLEANDCFIRIDGLNFCTRKSDLHTTVSYFLKNDLDFLKFNDNFPPQISFEIYRKDAFIKMFKKLKELPASFHVHIKHAHVFIPNLKSSYYEPEIISNDFLLEARSKMSKVYEKPRGYSSDKAIKAGDQLSFHYDIALDMVTSGMKILDIACGDGTGSSRLASKSTFVFGVDIDKEQIVINNERNLLKNLIFKTENGESLSFEDNFFDLVTSMETIEHCDSPLLFLKELHRVLMPGGILLISTPQNSHGEVPLNIAHHVEFSAQQFLHLLDNYFEIEKFLPIKSGRIINEISNEGQNSFAICRKK